jgi:chromosome segregation ATPase
MRTLIALLIEPTMYFVIGFLLAALLSLPFVGAVHRRAVRLTKQGLNSQLPMSVEELRAEKDLLRAEFAASTLRLENSLDSMKARTAAQRAEIGRHGHTVTTLKAELGAKAKTIWALEARETALKQQLRATEQEHSLKSINLEDAQRALMGKEAELARLAADLGERTMIADQQNVELAKARTNVEALKTNVQDLNREVEALNTRLVQNREDSEKASRELADERGRVENLGRRVADLEIELVAQRNDAEALSKLTADRFCDQARSLAAQEYEGDRMRIALEGAHRLETSLRSELTQLEQQRLVEAKAALAETATLQTQIAQLQQERQQLQWELKRMRRDAENTQSADRVESAMLRERINEVSEQVALLRTVLQAAASTPASDDKIKLASGESRNGASVNGHGATAGSPFAALDDIFVHEFRTGGETATPRPVAN